MKKRNYIASNTPQEFGRDTPWHAAVLRHRIGAVTGKVLRTYYVPACSGRPLGGSWGYTTVEELPRNATRCRRCFPNKET